MCRVKYVTDKPSPPLNLRPKDYSKDYITVTWDVPESDGGAPITGYRVEKRDAKRDNFTKVGETNSKTLEIKASKLVEGNQYYFRVYAINEVGESKPAVTDEPITAKLPFDPPGPPVNLTANDITRTSVTLTWETPEFDGGSPITGYYVEKNIGKRWVKVNKKATMKLTREVTDHREGETYEYRVCAENLAGVGEPCTPIQFVSKDPFTVPSQPGQPVIEDMTNEGVKLSWSKPETDGGSPITTYIVEMKPKSGTKWKRVNKDNVLDTNCVVPALEPEVECEFRILAENKAGKSQPSQTTGVKYGE